MPRGDNAQTVRATLGLATPACGELLLIAQHHHRSLVDAIAARQGTRAEQIARGHARLSRQNLDLVLERRDLFERLPGASLLNVGGPATGD